MLFGTVNFRKVGEKTKDKRQKSQVKKKTKDKRQKSQGRNPDDWKSIYCIGLVSLKSKV